MIREREKEGRASLVIGRLALALVLALVGLLALRQVDSLDVGFHLKAGEHVLDGNGWPRTDPFSFTMREHRYVDTSWGYQALIAAIQRAFGASGLVLAHAGLALATFVLLVRTARLAPADPTVLVLLLLVGALACELRFAVRPEMLSLLLLAALLHLLHRHAEGRRAPLGLLPLLFLVWANVHALFVLGWGALACFVAGLWIRHRSLDRRLAGWALASVAVAFVNPYGVRGVLFPFTLLTRFRASNPFHEEIGEFVSPFDSAALEAQVFYPWIPVQAFRLFVVLAGLACIGLLARKERRWWCVLLILVFAWPAASMIRNMPLLVVAGLPGVVWGLSPSGAGLAHRPRQAALAFAALVALLLSLRVASDAYYIDSRRGERFGLGWNESALPVDAVAYARAAGLEGLPLNHLNLGGWLMWAGGTPVFIDGRLEVVGEAFYGEYRRALSSQDALEACVQRWGIGWTIFPYATFPQLLGRLSKDPRWRLAYVDGVAALFVREGAGAARCVDPAWSARELPAALELERLPGFGAGPPRPKRFVRWAEGCFRRQRFPERDHVLGLFHLYRGELDESAARFAAAIRASEGRYFELYSNLGAVLFRKEQWEEAARCYRLVLAERPDDALALRRLDEIARQRLRR